ncbi:MAG TPA: conotoxin [Sunxiuqinia sp.]|nr:conotoxin [Sunxiuqinia sp.]
MKKLILMMAIVFAFGVTFASANTTTVQKARTEQTATISKDNKDKKEAKADKKEASTETKTCDKKESKSCCSGKKSCDKKAKE